MTQTADHMSKPVYICVFIPSFGWLSDWNSNKAVDRDSKSSPLPFRGHKNEPKTFNNTGWGSMKSEAKLCLEAVALTNVQGSEEGPQSSV